MKKLPEMLINWNVAEDIMRDLLNQYRDGEMGADKTVVSLDHLLAACTRRGGQLNLDRALWTPEDETFEKEIWDKFDAHVKTSSKRR